MFNPSVLLEAGARSGVADSDTIALLRKALTAGYGTDAAGLEGGAALRVQSLDEVMQETIAGEVDFRLLNRLPKPPAGATVDEWTEQSSVGGFLGGCAADEFSDIPAATGVYARRVGLVKFLATLRSVSVVQGAQRTIARSAALEERAGALQLLQDAEYLCFEGDFSIVSTEFDGIRAQTLAGVASGEVGPGNVIDMRGHGLISIAPFNRAAAQIAGHGKFGRPTDFYCSQLAQADLDTSLDPAFRVPLTSVPGGGIEVGSPVVGLRTSHGNIEMQPDVFIRDSEQRQPFELLYPGIAAANSTGTRNIKPSYVMAVPTSDPIDGSRFADDQAGAYGYLVTGLNASGQSMGVVSEQVTVIAGGAVTLTIGASAGGETGYVIHRTRLNGPAAIAGSFLGQGSDFREMVRIPSAGGQTIWTDLNAEIPGAVSAYMLDMRRSATAITWRQLLPMMKFRLYPGAAAVTPWAQLLFGYLRISKRGQHVLFKNVVPNREVWRPFQPFFEDGIDPEFSF